MDTLWRLLLTCSAATGLYGCLAELPEPTPTQPTDASGSDAAPTPDVGPLVDAFVDALFEDARAPLDLGAPDVGMVDATIADVGTPDEGPMVADIGAQDVGPPQPDMEAPDGGLPDAQVLDMALSDLGLPDAIIADQGPSDMGPSDMGPSDLGPPDAEPPDVGLRDADLADVAPPDAEPPDLGPQDEACTGFDDDLDGEIDEGGVCGPFIQASCRVTLGWSDNLAGPEDDWSGRPTDSWGACPPEGQDNGGDRRCVSTIGQGRLRGIEIGGGMDGNDQMGVAFTCASDERPEVARWIQSRCAVFLAHADANRGAEEGSPVWGPCPDDLEGVGPDNFIRCTSSGYDGRFRPMQLVGTVNQDDRFGVAFICDDLVDPQRAEAVEASAEVFLGWADDADQLGDSPLDRETFGGCPESSRDDDGDVRCVGSHGDGRFHLFNIGADAVGNRLGFFTRIISIFSVGLRSR